ncbi:predicted protein [Postia placenta Mad-698-R]|nr:predicted protein [Postia placenta Mad-698-R]
MSSQPFAFITPSTRGLSLALTRHLLRTTSMPVFATHRSDEPDTVRKQILSPLHDVDPARLKLLKLDLTSEDSIAAAAHKLSHLLKDNPKSHLQTAFFGGGVLHPERQPADLDFKQIQETFQINVISHLLLIKHFSPFLPGAQAALTQAAPLAKWVHISARVGSISDNNQGGWYSYRASKAALNQVVRTFDLHLKQKKLPVVCVGVHPGTVRTDLSRDFWAGVPKEKLFEPEYAAERLVEVVDNLKAGDRGKVWDWAGKEVPP